MTVMIERVTYVPLSSHGPAKAGHYSAALVQIGSADVETLLSVAVDSGSSRQIELSKGMLR